VTPGTFANGVEQILSATGTTVSQTWTVKLSSQVREKKLSYFVASRASSLPAKEQNSISNADGWMTSSDETPGSWIVFDKKITTQASSNILNNNKNTSNQTPSNALPPSFNAAPSVPTYNPGYIYPTTPISETAYTMATSYPSGNPGKTVNSTSDVPEGTNLYYTTVRFIADFVARFQSAFDSAFSNKTTDNLAEWTGSLYFTDSRAQNAMSGTVNTLSGNINSLSGRISIVEQNVTANLSGSLTSTNTDISTLSGRVNTLSGTVSSNFSTLLASLATKIGLTSLSATGGISYNSGTGLFSDLFTFSNGLTRIGNSIGISSVTGAQLSGFTAGQLAFGTASGGLTSTGGLFWDNTNGRIGIGTSSPISTLDVNGASNFRDTVTVASTKIINFKNAGIGSTTPGGFNWELTNDTASMYAVENTPDFTDYVFKMGDNATDNQDRYMFWHTSFNGTASDRWPLIMNGNYAAFDPRFSGNTSAGTMLSATMYMNYTTRNVGIWTTTPNSKLEINSGTWGLSGLRLTQLLSSSTGSINYSGILGVNSTGDVGIAQLTGNSFTGFTNGQLAFGTASGKLTQSSNLYWDNASGSLGIWTISMLDKFQINNGNISIVNSWWKVNSISDKIAGSINFRYGGNTGEQLTPVASIVGIDRYQWGGYLGAMGFNIMWTEAMRINEYKNIGIWTSSPNSKLEIDNTTANTSGLRFTRLTSTGTSSSLFSGILGVNSTGDVGIAQLTGNSFTGFTNWQITFGTASGGLTQSSNLYWDNTNGRLGINIASPTERIEVNGNIRSNGIISAVNTGTTNVFSLDSMDAVWPKLKMGTIWTPGWYFEIGAYNSQNNFDTKTRDLQFFWTSGNSIGIMLKATTGNVGIWTTNPNSKLEINAGTGWLSGLRFTQLTSANTGSTSNNFLTLDGSGNVVVGQVALWLINANGTYSSSTEVRDYNVWANRGNGFYLTDGGGAISNAIPNQGAWFSMSQVAKNAGYFGQTALNDQWFWFRWGNTTSISTNTWRKSLSLDANSRFDVQYGWTWTNLITLNNVDSGAVAFSTNNIERMRILAGGNVGIWTSSPNSKLEINSGTWGLSGLRFTQLLSSSTGSINYSGILGVNSTGDVGIAQLTGNSFTGFTAWQFTFGTASGGLAQSSNLTWDNVNSIFTLTGQIRLSAQTNNLASTPNFLIPSNNRLSFGETFYPPNDTGTVISFASQSATRNMTFAFGKTWVHTSFFSDNWSATMIGTEWAIPIVFRNWINYSATDISTSGTEIMRLAGNGNIGIGTASPTAQLHTTGTVRFQNFGAGTLTTDASGNLSVSSDERLKDKQGDFTKWLSVLENIIPISYKWNSTSGLETIWTYYGFSAQNVQSVLPEAVWMDNRGYLTLSDRPILATLVNAVKELNKSKASTGSLDALSGSLATISGQIALLSQASGSTVVNNYYNSGTTSSGTLSSWIDTAFSFVSSLIVRAEATFSEMVTFMKSVVFRSTVTFEDRVTFSDKDMAGTATIRAGESSVRVDFSHPYSEIPRVTVTADAFVTYRVTDKMVTGFTIETQAPVSADTNFDWMAVMVRGLGGTPVSSPSSWASSSSSTTSPSPETSSSGTITPESNTGTTSPTESGSITTPDTSITQTTVSGEVTP
jgi:Chaperone of endosialidase